METLKHESCSVLPVGAIESRDNPMMPEHYTRIEDWTESDLLTLPNMETDDYEYKSSRLAESPNYRTELQSKLCKAASAFWNTGGGTFIGGVDDRANIDGGLPDMMGKQRLRDWIDQVLNSVTPIGPYTVKVIPPELPDSKILAGRVVLVVAFGESFDLPHMAHDHRYYVRAGAHSSPANHYLVEAIRARRGLRRPMLRGLLREHPHKPGVIELLITSINDTPALNVLINFEPLPTVYQKVFQLRFPLQVPIIDRENPFVMDIATVRTRDSWLGKHPLYLKLTYEGVMGNRYHEQQLLDHQRSLSPLQLYPKQRDQPSKVLKKISAQLSRLNEILEARLRPIENGQILQMDEEE
jgi:hypothetical protein